MLHELVTCTEALHRFIGTWRRRIVFRSIANRRPRGGQRRKKEENMWKLLLPTLGLAATVFIVSPQESFGQGAGNPCACGIDTDQDRITGLNDSSIANRLHLTGCVVGAEAGNS